MATKRKGLGKGLDSMIPNKQPAAVKTESDAGSLMMDIGKIEPNRDQPRKNFAEDELQELADSIKLHGVIEPLVVLKRDDYYMIISGERRWRAAKLAEQKQVPVVVRENMTDQEILELSLIENIQREDLNPIEEALTYKRLLDEFNLKQDEVAERVSKSRTTVTNSIRLLKLDSRVQDMVIDGRISTGHARAILGISDKTAQFDFAQRCLDEKLSVREVEKEIKRMQKEGIKKPVEKAPKIDPQMEAIYGDISENIKKILGTKVAISPKDEKSGKVEIEYYSQDELNRIYDLLRTIKG